MLLRSIVACYGEEQRDACLRFTRHTHSRQTQQQHHAHVSQREEQRTPRLVDGYCHESISLPRRSSDTRTPTSTHHVVHDNNSITLSAQHHTHTHAPRGCEGGPRCLTPHLHPFLPPPSQPFALSLPSSWSKSITCVASQHRCGMGYTHTHHI